MPQTSQRPLDLPRWEWRTLATSLGDLRFALRGVPIERVRNIEETYLLCARSSHNAKIREGLMDLKWRKQVGRHGLELWDPVLKSTFPCEAEVLLQLFGGWGIPVPELARRRYAQQEFLEEVVVPHPDLQAVRVAKVREGFTLDGTTCELVRLEVSGMQLESFCAEHEDPRLVLQVLHGLGLDNRPNINYPMGLKHALARWAA